MGITAAFQRTFQVSGLAFNSSRQVSSDVAPPWSVDVPAAKAGQLTTRTSDTAGTLTMANGHGFTDGVKLHLYWTVGGVQGTCRATVGTVVTNSVPFTGGVGDPLPTNMTNVTAMVPNTEVLAVPGNSLVALAVNCPIGGTVVFADASNNELYVSVRTPQNTSDVVVTADGTNPLAGDTVAKIILSHPSSSGPSTLTGAVMYN